MGTLSYLPSGLPETIGPNILPYCIGDRGSTENTEWDNLQFVKVDSPMERLTKMYVTSPESWATWLLTEHITGFGMVNLEHIRMHCRLIRICFRICIQT